MLQLLHLGLLLGRSCMDLNVLKSLRLPFLHLCENFVVVLKFSKLLELKPELLANARPLKVIANTTLRLKLTS